MRDRIKVAPTAAAQIRTAATWWHRNREKAPAAFREELERAFDLVLTLPSVGERVEHPHYPDLRRLLIGRIRYFLYYHPETDSGAIEVLALWHTARGAEPTLPE